MIHDFTYLLIYLIVFKKL